MRWELTPRGYAALATLLICAAFALRMPVLRTGFTVDDYAQLGMMRGLFPVPRHSLQLFTFSEGGTAENERLRAAGFFPWWSHPNLRISLFRPLASALMWLDLTLFGHDAFAYHLHSTAWWLCMMVLFALVLRRVLPAWPALLALALCSAQSSHGMFLGWIANRNAVVASSFAMLGLLLLLRAREPASRGARALALGSFALALGAGEYAIGYLAYAACHEMRGAQSLRQRVTRLAPWAGLFTVYLAVRTSLGFGTNRSGMYIDPLAETQAFLRAAAYRLPMSVGDLVLGVQANWWSGGFPYAERAVSLGLWPAVWVHDLRHHQTALVACGAGAMLIAIGVGFAVLRGGASTVCAGNRWLVAAIPLALLPSLASAPESRLLLPALFGWSILMASWAWDWLANTAPARRPAFRYAGGLVIATLVGCQLIGPPIYADSMVHDLPEVAERVRASILAPDLDPVLRDRRVLLLGAADPTTSIYLPIVRRVHGVAAPRSCQLLTSAFAEHRLTRLSATTFVLERLQTELTPLDIYATAFNRGPPHAGDSFTSDGMSVTVERAIEGRPIRTRYTLDRTLDDPTLVLLQQTFFGLRRVTFPPTGESLVVDRPLPPLGLVTSAKTRMGT